MQRKVTRRKYPAIYEREIVDSSCNLFFLEGECFNQVNACIMNKRRFILCFAWKKDRNKQKHISNVQEMFYSKSNLQLDIRDCFNRHDFDRWIINNRNAMWQRQRMNRLKSTKRNKEQTFLLVSVFHSTFLFPLDY